MSDNDPSNSSSPESDSNQLPREDTLVSGDVVDPLDEGYTPPDRPRSGLYDETGTDQAAGEPIGRELAAEEPEVWESHGGSAADSGTPDAVAGRLVEDDDALDGRGNDVFADDAGVAGGVASPEESAIHLIPDKG